MWCIGVLAVGILLRLIQLDADPYSLEWLGYITDEGLWIHRARALALYGTVVPSSLTNINFFLAPLFQFANLAVFEVFGVSLFTSRLLTAACGAGMLVAFWAALRRHATPRALFLGTTLLAVQPDMVMLSRLAIPEMVILFFQMAIYVVIVSENASSWRSVVAGFLLLVGCAMKATLALMLPLFSLMIVAMPRKPDESPGWKHLIFFWIGFAVPMVAVGWVYSIVFFEPDHMRILSGHLSTIRSFLRWSSLYQVISFPFENSLSSTINLWTLGLWLTALGWDAAGSRNIEFGSYRRLRTSAVWIAGYMMYALGLSYFPSRYTVHILLPMAIFITVGVGVIERIGMRKITEHFAETEGASGLVRLVLLGVPTAAFLSPMVMSVLAIFDMNVERLLAKLACLAMSVLATTYVAHRVKHDRQAMVWLLIFPLVAGFVWAGVSVMVGAYSFWPTAGVESSALPVSLAVLSAMALSAIFVKAHAAWSSRIGGYAITSAAFLCLTMMAARIAPGYVNPQFSMREISRDLGRLLGNYSTITALRTDTLFAENKLPYRSSLDIAWPPDKSEIIVAAFDVGPWSEILRRDYQAMTHYRLPLSAKDLRPEPGSGRAKPESVTVTVYKRNDPVTTIH